MGKEEVTPDVKQETTPAEEVKEQQVTQDVKQDNIPYARFKEIVASNKELKEKVQKFESAAEDQRLKELEKKGEYETLLGEMKTKYDEAKVKADTLDEFVATDTEAILSHYSDEEREFLDGMSLDKLKKFHASNISKQKVSVDTSRAGMGSAIPKSFHEMTEEERRDPATWGAYLKNLRS